MLKQGFFLMIYNKDVVCVINQHETPHCEIIKRLQSSRRNDGINKNIPSHDPYIPRPNTVFYDCSTSECNGVNLKSITQLTSPNLVLKSCFEQASDKYKCETIRYNYFKNIDKLLFLSTNIVNKTFYTVDCLVYTDGARVCHKKDGVDSYTKLVDTGTVTRPKEPSLLSQDEFICEQGQDKYINCDLDPFTPFEDGLRLKEKVALTDNVLLKTGSYVVILTKNCVDSWCGYSGRISTTRRMDRHEYEPPGGWVYRCYYANKQQICKSLYDGKIVDNTTDPEWQHVKNIGMN